MGRLTVELDVVLAHELEQANVVGILPPLLPLGSVYILTVSVRLGD